MTQKERYQYVIEWFQQNRPVAETELHYTDPYQLLVAVILSAQCTDKRVNLITPPLFEAYPTVQKMAEATVDEILFYIRSVSYPNSKAKHLSGTAKKLITDFDGIVPDTLEALTTLPGVGRKTANVIQSVIFEKPAMAVDTHVFRVSNRIGLTKNSKTPFETEKTLVKHIPSELLAIAHHWLILHGRYVCIARKPLCDQCGLTPYCVYFGKRNKKESAPLAVTPNGPTIGKKSK